MEKKEFGIKIKAMLTYNKKIHTAEGATVENFKRLNYLIVEMMNKGCKPAEIYSAVCTGKHADAEKYDLLCRITEQIKYPTLVYNPEVAYTDNLNVIKNTAMDESFVRGSNWMGTIASVTKTSPEDLYRFTQCYMILEQIGREEFIINSTVAEVGKVKKGYIPGELIGRCYHDTNIEILKKLSIVSKLVYCDLNDYQKLQNAISNPAKTFEERQLIMMAYNSANTFFELSTKFDMLGTKGVQGDTNRYVFLKFRNGIPYSTNKYRGAYSMAEIAKESERRCRLDFARISMSVSNMPVPESGDDTM